ncbi:MAG TPA: hypothetical protein VFO52_02995 [Longimicrobiales bacterium]|nr:hypothetical protein [Longimicrobiales bacterium]
MMTNWRQLLLGIVIISAGASLTELLLLEHFEEWTQLIPVVLLAALLLGTIAVLFSSARWLANTYRVILLLCLISAAAGLYLHYQANVEFVLERHPEARGWSLFKQAIMGGMPALAPGTMAQFALMGLLATLPPRSA